MANMLDGGFLSGENWQVGSGYFKKDKKMSEFLEKLADEKNKEPYINSFRNRIKKRMAKTR